MHCSCLTVLTYKNGNLMPEVVSGFLFFGEILTVTGQLRKESFPPKRDFKMLALAEGMQWAESTGAQDTVLGWGRGRRRQNRRHFAGGTKAETIILHRLAGSLGKKSRKLIPEPF